VNRQGPLVKQAEVRLSISDTGVAVGKPAVMGNCDRGGDVIMPGAFSKPVLDAFVANGFVSLGHDWAENPIGYVTKCEDAGTSLVAEWVYHSTDDAQEARTVAMERQAAGKSVGLSVGFQPDWSKVVMFDNGEKLWAWALGEGYDPMLLDPGIKDRTTCCWAMPVVNELYEFSQVTVPQNPKAVAARVKTLFGYDGPRTGMSLSDHSEAVRTAVAGLAERLSDYSEMREAKGRGFPARYFDDIRAMVETLGAVLENAPERQDARLLRVKLDALALDLVSL